MSSKVDSPTEHAPLYNRIRKILESAKLSVARSVNTAQVIAYWMIGREITEALQQGRRRAEYGERLLKQLSHRLAAEFGAGYSLHNLKFIRQFYLSYPKLIDIPDQVSNQLLNAIEIGYALRSQSWLPGRLHPDLSWTHYRTLLRVETPEARAFYEIKATTNHWSARELERQINSLLFDRLAVSKDKAGVLRLAKKGQEISGPKDVFKDPLIIEFLGLPESTRLVETTLEEALINNLHAFLLELGK